MTYRLILSSLLLLLYSCGQDKKENLIIRNSEDVKKSLPSEESYYSSEFDNLEISKDLVIKPFSKDLRIFTSDCYVYNSPNDTSNIVDTLTFNARIPIIEHIKNKNKEWYRISDNTHSGYIKKENLSIYSYRYSGYLIGYNEKDGRSRIELKSFANDNGKYIIDSFIFGDYKGDVIVKDLPFNGLENSGTYIIKYTTLHGGDATSYYYEYVAYDIDTRMFKKIVSYSSGYYDMCEFDEEIFYFPMKFDNGKILLVKDADYENIFNTQTAELNILEYPKHINIPIEQLIIKISRDAECVFDSSGSLVIDPSTKAGKMKITESEPVYYRWNGQELIEK